MKTRRKMFHAECIPVAKKGQSSSPVYFFSPSSQLILVQATIFHAGPGRPLWAILGCAKKIHCNS